MSRIRSSSFQLPSAQMITRLMLLFGGSQRSVKMEWMNRVSRYMNRQALLAKREYLYGRALPSRAQLPPSSEKMRFIYSLSKKLAGSFYFPLDKIINLIKIFALFNFLNNSIIWR